jgi:hypothetical protein
MRLSLTQRKWFKLLENHSSCLAAAAAAALSVLCAELIPKDQNPHEGVADSAKDASTFLDREHAIGINRG